MSGGKGGKGRGRLAGKRRRAREMAVQMLYQREVGGSELDSIFATFDRHDYSRDHADEDDGDGAVTPPPAPPNAADESRLAEAFNYARRLVAGTVEHRAEIDELIRRHAENWRLERMPTIDRNILRLALYEMLHHEGVPKVVIVDEAIELAKKFGSENSGRFVNGLLDGYLKSLTGRAGAAKERRATPSAAGGGE